MRFYPQTMQNTKKSPQRIAILLFDQFSNHCLANALEPLRAANTLSRRVLYEWQIVTISGDVVTSSSGLKLMPDLPIRDVPKGDYLFVLPSYGHLKHATPANLRSLRGAAGKFDTLVGLDTGAWLMAAAGLLENRRATIHWDELESFAEKFPDIEVVRDRIVMDGNRLTCGGASTAFELVMELIEQHHGKRLRLEITSLFMQGDTRHLNDPSLRPTGSQIVDGTVALMRQNMEEPLPLPEVARRAGCSQKRLTQLFQQHLSAPPKTVYKRLRLIEARRLSEQSTYPVAEIALRCGYADASAMTRAFVAEFGQPPRAYRTDL